jgi:ankyrin repeat protein
MNLLVLAAAALMFNHYYDKEKQKEKHSMVAAAEAGSIKEVKKLLRKKINPDEKSDPVYGETALMVAARRADIPMMKTLIDAGAQVNYIANHDPSHQGRSALANALDSGSLDAVTVLIDAKVNINELVDIDIETRPTVQAHTLLVYAIYKKSSLNIMRFIIDKGADVNKPDVVGGWTPLMIAAYFGLTDAVELLIKSGADLEARNKIHNNHDARYYARKRGYTSIVKMLDDAVGSKKGTNN